MKNQKRKRDEEKGKIKRSKKKETELLLPKCLPTLMLTVEERKKTHRSCHLPSVLKLWQLKQYQKCLFKLKLKNPKRHGRPLA